MKPSALARVAVCMCLFACLPGISQAAQVQPDELQAMREEAARAGVAPVMVHLEASTLAELRSAPGRIRSAAAVKAARLLAELGPDALRSGRWSNGMGQIGLHVTARGLDMLLHTTNAISFAQGTPWAQRSLLDGSDGAHAAIERSLRENGFADVEVLLNAEGMAVTRGRDGRAGFHADLPALQRAGAKLAETIRSAGPGAFADTARVAQAAADASSGLLMAMRATREGVLALSESDAIRSLRPAGHVDARPLEIDPDAIAQAAVHGEADVLVVMRDPYAGGKLSPASVAAMAKGNREALDDILTTAGGGQVRADFARFGAVQASLSAEQLEALRNRRDPRLLAVTLNKPVATTQLATSGPTMNMASAWNAGFTATGQNVIVIDSGIDATHPFFGGRVIYQSCHGTSGISGTTTWLSPCPGGTAANNWDSPPGTPNAAAPIAGSAHGTHVAGIAAGGAGSISLRGMAPGAGIVAIQVFSQEMGKTNATAFGTDLLAALQEVTSALPVLADGRAQPFTVNMSIGGAGFYSPCNTADKVPFIAAVSQLRAAGIPVVAATGNEGYLDRVDFPACLPGVVKVSAVANDKTEDRRAVFDGSKAANVVDPEKFPGEIFWFAAGGGGGTTVISSIIGGGYGGISGTSMASPHIAGVYADAKGAVPTFTPSDVSAWLQANASRFVSTTVLNGTTTKPVQWRRVSLPAL